MDQETNNVTTNEPTPMSYDDAPICDEIKKAIHEMGFENMTPIQEKAIPEILKGIDIIGQAQTGTGKTAAYGIPVIESIRKDVIWEMQNRDYLGIKALILCPTRELAIQVSRELRNFTKYLQNVKVLPIYGGQDMSRQIRSLHENVQIVVGTPGRVMDHMRRHSLKIDRLKMLVLDEADEMLNMGFREDIETICETMPEDRQTLLFSATMPDSILKITKEYQRDAKLLKTAAKEITIPLVKQYYYEVSSKNKDDVVCRLIDYYDPKRSLIFCNTKKKVDELAEELQSRGYDAEALHGDLSQAQRDNVMNRFRGGKVDILIATDVAARGIDVDDVETVINYDIPQDIEYYVHRIGRTGRAGKTGRSFTLVVGREIFKIRDIERTCKTKMKARAVPSAADVTNINAEKILTEVIRIAQAGDLTKTQSIIEAHINEDNITAIEIAAAFLKQQMGKELQDIPTEKYVPENRYKNKGQKDKARFGGKGRYNDNKRGSWKNDRYGKSGSSDDKKPKKFANGKSFSDKPDRGFKSSGKAFAKKSKSFDK